MSDLPSMPLFVDDYEAATAHLTLEEDGAYNRLLRLCWRSPGCSIPDDDAWIMRRMRADEATFQRVILPILDEFFTRKNGRVFQKRQQEEYDYVSERTEARKVAGRKGGISKAQKTKEKVSSNATVLPEQKASNALAPIPIPILKDSDANASGGDAADFAKIVFDRGVAFLCKHGHREQHARSLIGKWRKDHGDREIFDAFAAASKEGVTDPAAWIVARLGAPPSTASLDELFRRAKEVER